MMLVAGTKAHLDCPVDLTGQPASSSNKRLHALDITTGAEKFGGPVVIQASVPGTGTGASGGFVLTSVNRLPAC
jgi:hypothetical protein